MEQINNIWKPLSDIDWAIAGDVDGAGKMFSIDTRDFHVCCTNTSYTIEILRTIRHELTKICGSIYKQLRKTPEADKIPADITKKADIRKYLTPQINKILVDQYFFTAEEIKALVDKWFTDSGGAGRWRMFGFENASDDVTGWDWKYIRIYKIPDFGFLVGPGTEYKQRIFLRKEDILGFVIKQNNLHTH